MPGDRVRALATTAGLALAPVRAMSGNAQVLALPRVMRNTDVQAVVDRIRRDPTVESAWVDAREQLMATPTRAEFGVQLTTVVVGSWAAASAGAISEATRTAPEPSQSRKALPSPTCMRRG